MSDVSPHAATAAGVIAAACGHAADRYEADISTIRPDLAEITVSSHYATALVRDLRAAHGFAHLVFLTAVDLIEREQFRLVYMLHNPETHVDVSVQTEIPRINASMDSIHDLWAQAPTYQRELKEMFGIDFPGSPGVDDPFILEGWDNIPPMRRDFDTKRYSEDTYFPRGGRETTDTKEHMRARLYPDPPEDGA